MGELIHAHDAARRVGTDGVDASAAEKRAEILEEARRYASLFSHAALAERAPSARCCLDDAVGQSEQPSACLGQSAALFVDHREDAAQVDRKSVV